MLVVFYRDEDGIPALEWLSKLPDRTHAKGLIRIERLSELGHKLRRPEAEYLRDGIYELRWKVGHVNYRLLYFFHGSTVPLCRKPTLPPSRILWADSIETASYCFAVGCPTSHLNLAPGFFPPEMYTFGKPVLFWAHRPAVGPGA